MPSQVSSASISGPIPLDLRQREAVALLHVENGVIAENEGRAVVLFAAGFIFLLTVAELFVEHNLCSLFAFADSSV
jgi:hypothetical protein